MISTKKLIYQIITKIATPPFDVVYPVGSYYETSDTSFNPNTAWGGTWVLETAGRVHVSAGSGYTAGTSGDDYNLTTILTTLGWLNDVIV